MTHGNPDDWHRITGDVTNGYGTCNKCGPDTRVHKTSYPTKTGPKASWRCANGSYDARKGKKQESHQSNGIRAWCIWCKQWKSVLAFGRTKSKPGGINNICRKCRYNAKLEGQYGITPDQRQKILKAQNDECAIDVCSIQETSDTLLNIDHNHGTGEVRGLLCFRHNVAIGHANDSPTELRSLASYLERYQTK